MKIDITEIDYQEAHAEHGTGHWGVKLGTQDIIAWECPMLGDGGVSTEDQDAIAWLFSQYSDESKLNPEEGPDEILFVQGDSYYLATITVE